MKYFAIILNLLAIGLSAGGDSPKSKPKEPFVLDASFFRNIIGPKGPTLNLREICTIDGELAKNCHPNFPDRALVLEAEDSLIFETLDVIAQKLTIRGNITAKEATFRVKTTNISGSVDAQQLQIIGRFFTLKDSGTLSVGVNAPVNAKPVFDLVVDYAYIHGVTKVSGAISWYISAVYFFPKAFVTADFGAIFSKLFRNDQGQLRFSDTGKLTRHPHHPKLTIENLGGAIRSGGELILEADLLKNRRAGLNVEVFNFHRPVALPRLQKEPWSPKIQYNGTQALIDNQTADLLDLEPWMAGQGEKFAPMMEYATHRKVNAASVGSPGLISSGKDIVFDVHKAEIYLSDIKSGGNFICPDNGSACDDIVLTGMNLQAQVSLVPGDIWFKDWLEQENPWTSFGRFFKSLILGPNSLLKFHHDSKSKIFEELKANNETELSYMPLEADGESLEIFTCNALTLNFGPESTAVPCDSFDHGQIGASIISRYGLTGSARRLRHSFVRYGASGEISKDQFAAYQIVKLADLKPQDRMRRPTENLKVIERQERIQPAALADWSAESRKQQLRLENARTGQKQIAGGPIYRHQSESQLIEGVSDPFALFNELAKSSLPESDGLASAVALYEVDGALQYRLLEYAISQDLGPGIITPIELVENAMKLKYEGNLAVGDFPKDDFLQQLPEGFSFIWPVDGLDDAGDRVREFLLFYDPITALRVKNNERVSLGAKYLNLDTEHLASQGATRVDGDMRLRNDNNVEVKLGNAEIRGDFRVESVNGNVTVAGNGYEDSSEETVYQDGLSGEQKIEHAAYEPGKISVGKNTVLDAENGYSKIHGVELDTGSLQVSGNLMIEGAVGSTKWASDMSGWCLFCDNNIFARKSEQLTKYQEQAYQSVVNIRNGDNSFVDGDLNLRGSVLDIYEGVLDVSGEILSEEIQACFQTEFSQDEYGLSVSPTISWRELSIGLKLGGGPTWFQEKGCKAVTSSIRSTMGARLKSTGKSKHVGTDFEFVSVEGGKAEFLAAEEAYEVRAGGFDASVGVMAGVQSSIADLYDRAMDISRHMKQGGKIGVLNLGFDAIHTAADVARLLENPGRAGLWAQAQANGYGTVTSGLKHKCPTLVSVGEEIVADEVTLQCLQAYGTEFGIKARRLSSLSAEDFEKTHFIGLGGKVEVTLPGMGVGSVVSGDANIKTNSTESTNQRYSHLNFADRVVLEINEDAQLEAMSIVAKQVDAQFGTLILASVANRLTSSGFNFEIGLTVTEINDALRGLLNGGIGGQGAESIWVSELSKIIGTEGVRLVVEDAIEMTSSMIANADLDPSTGEYVDGGNMVVQAATIIENELKTVNEQLAGNLGLGGGGAETAVPLFGSFSLGGEKKSGHVRSAFGRAHWIDPNYDGSESEYEEVIEWDSGGNECRRGPGELCYFGNQDLNDLGFSETIWEIPQIDAYLAHIDFKRMGNNARNRLQQIGDFFAEINALRGVERREPRVRRENAADLPEKAAEETAKSLEHRRRAQENEALLGEHGEELSSGAKELLEQETQVEKTYEEYHAAQAEAAENFDGTVEEFRDASIDATLGNLNQILGSLETADPEAAARLQAEYIDPIQRDVDRGDSMSAQAKIGLLIEGGKLALSVWPIGNYIVMGIDTLEASTGYSLALEELTPSQRAFIGGLAAVGVIPGGRVAGTVAKGGAKILGPLARVGKPALKGAGRVADVLAETFAGKGNLLSKFTLTSDEALEAGIKWVGPGYREIGKPGSGVFRSKDGLRQFRIDKNSLQGRHSPHDPHVHFETYEAGAREFAANNHVLLVEKL